MSTHKPLPKPFLKQARSPWWLVCVPFRSKEEAKRFLSIAALSQESALPQIHDHQWLTPAQGFIAECCSCGLRHRMEFAVFAKGRRLDGRKVTIKFRARRLPRRK
jgi:hypothetical protein